VYRAGAGDSSLLEFAKEEGKLGTIVKILGGGVLVSRLDGRTSVLGIFVLECSVKYVSCWPRQR